jgi:hypothetical protein
MTTPVQDVTKEMISENSWIVHCLSMATIGMLAYMQLAPVIA